VHQAYTWAKHHEVECTWVNKTHVILHFNTRRTGRPRKGTPKGGEEHHIKTEDEHQILQLPTNIYQYGSIIL
jgi:hypothetical protein